MGSSPRGRGKPKAACPTRRSDRLIPARAGKTGYLTRRTRQFAAHPRAGGENRQGILTHVSAGGSSPRGRGKRGRWIVETQTGGLIPARAGKTAPNPSVNWRARAHPRAGGENKRIIMGAKRSDGSSPRGRGKPRAVLRLGTERRLIPARAGKTSSPRPRISAEPAHPRAGGENAAYVGDVPNDTGSSPRGRGKRNQRICDVLDLRLIPARAGKTGEGTGERGDRRAHPRAGGENAFRWAIRASASGSSPRGRGKRRAQTAIRRPSGLIPARAGKTSSPWLSA